VKELDVKELDYLEVRNEISVDSVGDSFCVNALIHLLELDQVGLGSKFDCSGNENEAQYFDSRKSEKTKLANLIGLLWSRNQVHCKVHRPRKKAVVLLEVGTEIGQFFVDVFAMIVFHGHDPSHGHEKWFQSLVHGRDREHYRDDVHDHDVDAVLCFDLNGLLLKIDSMLIDPNDESKGVDVADVVIAHGEEVLEEGTLQRKQKDVLNLQHEVSFHLACYIYEKKEMGKKSIKNTYKATFLY